MAFRNLRKPSLRIRIPHLPLGILLGRNLPKGWFDQRRLHWRLWIVRQGSLQLRTVHPPLRSLHPQLRTLQPPLRILRIPLRRLARS
ncbi:unnamed protein product [Acanthoscelides obtectus]|uniref:Uncharacterized protein n=1 Tax=Acanthoscelides obtectus TaxID=200917 RepID=A0A9P0L9N3_ACAOB|nr:unnamed protein product [Acanthoscelides obtectus]CAK1670653.1 hypothetical protein AOBTE_LOCUS27736 [Acanthoscelides obtectus]